jgi:hypothetical protein
MTNKRTISQIDAEGYPWIGYECCKGTVRVSIDPRCLKIAMPAKTDSIGQRYCRSHEKYFQTPKSKTLATTGKAIERVRLSRELISDFVIQKTPIPPA